MEGMRNFKMPRFNKPVGRRNSIHQMHLTGDAENLSQTSSSHLQPTQDIDQVGILRSAVWEQDVTAVKALLSPLSEAQTYRLLEMKTEWDWTPLHSALTHDQPLVVTALLSALSEELRYRLLNTEDTLGRTPLHWAEILNKPTVASAVLDLLCEEQRFRLLEKKDKWAETPLHWAVINENLSVVKVLLCSVSEEQRYKLLDMNDMWTGTPLYYAIRGSEPAMVSELLCSISMEHRYKLLNMKGERDYTPLHNVAILDKASMVRILLNGLSEDQRFKLLEMKDIWGNTPLHIAVREDYSSVVAAFLGLFNEEQRSRLLEIKDGQGWTPLHSASILTESGVATALLSQFDVESSYKMLSLPDKSGNTPLHIAVRKVNPSVVRAFLGPFNDKLRFGLLNMKEGLEWTPLHCAVMNNSVEIVKILMVSVTSENWLNLLKKKTCNKKTPTQLASGECRRLIEWSMIPKAFYLLPCLPTILIFYNVIDRQVDGAEECAAIRSVLTDELQCDVTECQDFTDQDLFAKITEATERGPTSCLIVVTLSHGHRGAILDRNETSIDINDIIIHMNKPHLNTVPKLLLVQSCQDLPSGTSSTIVEHARPQRATVPTRLSDAVIDPRPTNASRSPRLQPSPPIELRSDHFCVIVSSVSFGLSYRNCFIPLFANQLKLSEKNESVNDIFEMTHKALTEKSPGQTAILLTTLRYKLALKSAYDPNQNSMCAVM